MSSTPSDRRSSTDTSTVTGFGSNPPLVVQPTSPGTPMSGSDSSSSSGGASDASSENPAALTPRITGELGRGRRAEPMLMEIAWEVCNQVGGIYTVLRSKAPSMVSRWGNRYCLVGPYRSQTADIEFEASTPTGPIGAAVNLLREQGVGVHYGRWMVSGRPHVVLLETGAAHGYLNDVKARLWRDHAIPSSDGDAMVDDCLAFGELVRRFLVALGEKEGQRRKLVAHFHEWMAGVPIPMLRQENWPGASVFTTHATLIGRYLAMNDPDFYDNLAHFDADAEARHFNVESQHRIEAAAAHGSHVFTTVSDVTAQECRHLLKRPPEVLLPNGLNIQKFDTVHEVQNRHRLAKEKIHRFTVGHFFPSYDFDLDNTLYFFSSGRFEFRNKGYDLALESLARLNHRLKETGSALNIVFFLITRVPNRSINVHTLQHRTMLGEFEEATEAIKAQVHDKVFDSVTRGQIPDLNNLIDEYWRLRLKRTMAAFRRPGLPPITTHDLVDDAGDEVLNSLRRCQLLNGPEDRVKVIYHPDFIKSTNPLFGMDYDEFVRGCHLGIFPSYYEPWGYTPLESIALGVPAVTSDLAGFGSYLAQVLPEHDDQGLYVCNRRGRDFHQGADHMAELMFEFCQKTRRERVILRNQVEQFAVHFDWHNLARRYNEAHDMAMDRLVTA